jgi:hypothetical protein
VRTYPEKKEVKRRRGEEEKQKMPQNSVLNNRYNIFYLPLLLFSS